jgi:hypothetical protein
MKKQKEYAKGIDSYTNSKYFKYLKYAIYLGAGVVIIGVGSRLLAQTVRGVNELKSALNGN